MSKKNTVLLTYYNEIPIFVDEDGKFLVDVGEEEVSRLTLGGIKKVIDTEKRPFQAIQVYPHQFVEPVRVLVTEIHSDGVGVVLGKTTHNLYVPNLHVERQLIYINAEYNSLVSDIRKRREELVRQLVPVRKQDLLHLRQVNKETDNDR